MMPSVPRDRVLRGAVALAALLAGTHATASAQTAAGTPAAREPEVAQADLSVWVGGRFLGSVITAPQDDYRWRFDPGFGAGAGVHHRVSRDVDFGVDLGVLVPEYTFRAVHPSIEPAGGTDRGRIGVLLTTLQLHFREDLPVAPYLTAATGLLIYWLPDIDRTDPELAFQIGAGADLPFTGERLFLELNHVWTFGKNPSMAGVEAAKHIHLKLGTRFSW